jgi:hypothetical protein
VDLSVNALLQPDVLAGQLFFQAYGKSNFSQPERSLLFAVLNDAIQIFQKFALSKSAQQRRLFREAESWIWDDAADFVFSFRNICDLLEVEPVYLRRGLQQLQQRDQTSKFVKTRLRCRQTVGRNQAKRRVAEMVI